MGANLRILRRRIRSVQNIQQITRAMKLVATARLARAQERALRGRPYYERLERMFAELSQIAPRVEHPLTKIRESGKVLAVVISGDRGLCGAFNLNVIREALKLWQENEGRVEYVAIGAKAQTFLSGRGYPVVRSWTRLPMDVPQWVMTEIGGYLKKAYEAEPAEENKAEAYQQVQMIYTRFESLARQSVRRMPLLPVVWEGEPAGGGERQALFEPEPGEILKALYPRLVDVRLGRALLESFASEQAARMVAMDQATENAEEVIRELTRLYNTARQESITKELMDIVGGAEALK
ncbi:MAG: ATP synthase F1 subunit gamma [bacterium JZ-2024 1]